MRDARGGVGVHIPWVERGSMERFGLYLLNHGSCGTHGSLTFGDLFGGKFFGGSCNGSSLGRRVVGSSLSLKTYFLDNGFDGLERLFWNLLSMHISLTQYSIEERILLFL